MTTKTDIIKRAYQHLRRVRFGEAVPGELLNEAAPIFDDYLADLNQRITLDFDITGADVPNEHAFALSMALAQVLAPGAGREFNERLLDRYERKFTASVVDESDFVDVEPRDY